MSPRWNAKTRLILTLELAVILPVGVLIGLSVHHLKHIERDKAVAAAIQRDFNSAPASSRGDKKVSLADLIVLAGEAPAADLPIGGDCAEEEGGH